MANCSPTADYWSCYLRQTAATLTWACSRSSYLEGSCGCVPRSGNQSVVLVEHVTHHSQLCVHESVQSRPANGMEDTAVLPCQPMVRSPMQCIVLEAKECCRAHVSMITRQGLVLHHRTQHMICASTPFQTKDVAAIELVVGLACGFSVMQATPVQHSQC
jgi:hypothetical protein